MAMTLPATNNQTSDVTEEQQTPERPREVEWVVTSVEMVRKLGGGTDKLWCSWDGTPQGFRAGYNPGGQHGFFIDTVVSLQTALGEALRSRSAGEDLHRAFNFPGARGITIRATLKEQGAVYHFSPLARR